MNKTDENLSKKGVAKMLFMMLFLGIGAILCILYILHMIRVEKKREQMELLLLKHIAKQQTELDQLAQDHQFRPSDK